MTDLQMGLIGFGGVAVLGVLAYNKWQERKHRRMAEELLSARQTDVLLDEPGGATGGAAAADAAHRAPQERVEPLLRSDPEEFREPGESALGQNTAADSGHTAAAAKSAATAEESPSSHSSHSSPASVSPTPADDQRGGLRDSPAPMSVLSPKIDYIAAIQVVEPIAGCRIREAQRATLERLSKAVNWIGHNEDAHAWEPILDDSEREYRHIRVGLQLVDRKGPLADRELSVFKVAMQEMATELMGLAELPAREPALRTAAQLDEFCAGVDIQIGVNVISQGQVFAGTKLRALAEATGMVIDSSGRFVRCDDDGDVLYMLLNQQADGFSAESMKTLTTHGVTFLLDVPRVANGDRVLTQMFELARRFAEALNGALVDDNRHPLSEAALEPIRQQVAQFQAAMAAHELPAGGPLALRLFS
ncbi:MAG: cell division protein ZipA [Candidatus Accumulibacter appositus]|uniref:Cell division protein ZipA n=1 Tax=Candidatus Accumulibacter appositus TaxID=1454003 RepID=A0A011QHG7_9PROT|nr:cell division protein ZipA C-terminal FtsZ-binding domain-containing protein [Accumulibacter sp.]EXI78279.1 MAG: cell division protein ZipA [Candidatus Accumulibacter appositus]HRF06628.1 cell division protein ZipA C-terminal FtsZ-binding domain-containing protein [Accumulibacter sp.]